MKKNIPSLIGELRNEAWHEGYQAALYNHHEHSHTVQTRQKMLNHKAIKEKVEAEILHELKQVQK